RASCRCTTKIGPFGLAFPRLPPKGSGVFFRSRLRSYSPSFFGTFVSLESYSYRSHNAYIAGISLWTVWTAATLDHDEPPETSRKLPSGEDAQRAEARTAAAAEVVARDPVQLGER